ncbi:MAG: hypothetical protein H7Y32_16410 [Chloroflexales bacterium]|nr:hypothetical protein [Chloroflexales bacterium]
MKKHQTKQSRRPSSVARGQWLTPRQTRPELFGACQVERGLHDRVG